ncbi:T9SS type A sorting domain-containing protein [Brumimicrobium glaciale]|uniref:T9SS type A sorting domain-containing protein n=1 Tax=Brumimicrobium glaciale TaxID=200475 RepID=A0A4Q4KJT6_9FLAO|nr:T9SS type A sorting domain-containing protein [Brumimicrobium glaciale]RYM33522.1 T9SS type A sorting domain-containing protein [Brumimicrobium glaciale]
MKLKLLLLILPIFGTFFSHSQTELVVTAPSATATTGLRAPNGTSAHTTVRGVIIVTAAELAAIPTGTTITKLNMLMAAGVSPGPAGGNIEFYLENTPDVTNLKSTTWSTCISTMTSVYNGAFSLPTAIGPTAPLTLTTGFVYSGGSVYIAYDYLGSTFTTIAGTYDANTDVAGGWKGIVSSSTTPPVTISGSSAFRPCFQFTFTNPFTNELNVSGLAGEKGIFNNNIKSTQTITSQITNTSVGPLTNIPVTLIVAGANPYTISQTITTIAPGATETLLFNNVPTLNNGSQTLTVSIPADDDITNNTQVFNQQVQCDTIGYTQGSVQGSGVGFNTGTGVIAVRHEITSNFPTFVENVSNYFPVSVDNSGNTMKGLLINEAGTILDSTNLFTITAAMLGTKQIFSFINGAIDVSGDTIYVGFRQTANLITGYFPFANQLNSYVDPIAAATFPIFGGVPSPLGDGLGYMMIDATLTFDGFDVTNSSTNGVLCENSILDITPVNGFSNYEFFIGGVSVQNGIVSSYSTGPLTASTDFLVEITNGSCMFSSNLQAITVTPAQTYNISDGICQGDSYTLGTQTLTTGGSYTETFQSAAGCDSIINLSLVVNPPTSSSSTITLCASSYLFEGQNLTASGIYTETTTNANGCDSTITLDLTLNAPVTVTTSLTGATLTATATPTSATYQWFDCLTNTNVAGATAAVFNPTVNGEYAVIASSSNGCSDTSSCTVVSTVGLKDNVKSFGISLHPNPTNGAVTVLLENMEAKQYTLEVIDATGRKLKTQTITNNSTQVDLSNFNKGVYLIRISNETRESTHRIVKN